MFAEDLIAERIAIESYREIIQYLGNKDVTTRQLLESILAVEEEHAGDLRSMREEMLRQERGVTAPTASYRNSTSVRTCNERGARPPPCATWPRAALAPRALPLRRSLPRRRRPIPRATPLRPGVALLPERGNRLLSIALATLATIAAVWFLSWGKGILIPLSLALFLAICLMPPVHWLSRWRLPCALGAALVMLLLSGLVGVVIDRTRGDVMQLLDEVPPATRFLRHEVERSMDEPGSLAHRLKALVDLPQSSGPKSAGGAAHAAIAAPVPNVAEGTLQVVSFTGERRPCCFWYFCCSRRAIDCSPSELNRISLRPPRA